MILRFDRIDWGWRRLSPVYAMYEATTPEDEHNVRHEHEFTVLTVTSR